MKALKLFGLKSKKENDPYWVFDKKKHFKPKLNKGDFFRLKEFDFGWFILEPLSRFVNSPEEEVEKSISLSYGQKVLYYWWYLDAEVNNGGFVQFYYNGYDNYVQTIIKGLEFIGDTKMANLVKKADKIYQKKKRQIEKSQGKDLFDSDLYDELEELSVLDDYYFDYKDKTMSLIEKYIRNHSSEICVDENGEEIDTNYTGVCKTYYESSTIKEILHLKKGRIDGEYKVFYQNGNLKEKIQFVNGVETGVREEYYEEGNIKYQVVADKTKKIFIHKKFYENKNLKELESKLIDGEESFGEYKKWYKNGQLAESGNYKSNYQRDGKWLEFYEDGSKKVEAEYINSEFIIKNYWSEKGEQGLENGTGVYEQKNAGFFDEEAVQSFYQLKNYKMHGVQKTLTNGILTFYQEMNNGVKDGYTRNYYKNGNLKEEILYDKGAQVSIKEFPIFENPSVQTSIICEMEDEWLINRELDTAEVYPLPRNGKELASKLSIPISLFQGYPQDVTLSYNYFVSINKFGVVTNIDFLMADNGRITDKVEQNIKKLIFSPAKKGNIDVDSYLIVKHKFQLIE